MCSGRSYIKYNVVNTISTHSWYQTGSNTHKHASNADFVLILFEITSAIFQFREENITSQYLMFGQIKHYTICARTEVHKPVGNTPSKQRTFGEITHLQPGPLN